MSNKEWKAASWFQDSDQEAARCFFDIGNHRVLDDGVIRFDLVIYTDTGDIVLKGFRYDPKEAKLMPPCYRVGGGWQSLAVLKGPIEEMVLEMAQEMVEAEPVEAVEQAAAVAP